MDNAMKAILEAAREYGFFQHRADVADYDFETADVFLPNTWYDLDLSAIVPEHAHAVLLRWVYRSSSASHYAVIRRKGYTVGRVAAYIDVSVANMYEREDVVVGIGPDRIIQGFKQGGPASVFLLVVKGWWW